MSLLYRMEGKMEYRINRKTGDRISVIGLGTSYIAETEENEALKALEFAYENGINYADLATADARTFTYYGKAFSSVRKDMYYQIHFGANYENGSYGWSTDKEKNPAFRRRPAYGAADGLHRLWIYPLPG